MLTGSILVLIVSPLFFNPFGYDQYQLPRLALQALAIIIGLVALVVTVGLPDRRTVVPLIALLGALGLGALFSEAPVVALLGTSSRRFGLVEWAILAAALTLGRSMSTPVQRGLMTTALAASSALVAVYAIAQRLGWDPFSPDGSGPALRPASTLGGATYLGGYLALALAVAVARLMGGNRALWVIPVIVFDATALLLTQSRGGWIGGLVGAAVAVGWTVQRTTDRRSLAISGAVAAVALVVAIAVIPGLASRAASFAHPTRGTAGARFDLGEIGLAAVLDRPVIGWGPDMSRAALHDHLTPTFEREHQDARVEDRAHNFLIDIAIWGGLVGLGAFGWLIVVVGRAAWATRVDWTVVTIALGVTAYGIHLLFNFPVPDLDVVVWLLAGSMVPWRQGDRVSLRPRFRAPTYLAAPVAAVVLLVVAVRSGDSLAADRSLRIAVDRENAGDAIGARHAYESAHQNAPTEALYDEALTRFYLRTSEPQLAAEAAERGMRSDPSDPYMIELHAHSLDSVALADAAALHSAVLAERALQTLIERAPNDGSVHLELGIALAIQGQTILAEGEFERAVQLIPKRCEPYRNLALMQEANRKPVEAHLNFQIALVCMPQDPVAAEGVARTAP